MLTNIEIQNFGPIKSVSLKPAAVNVINEIEAKNRNLIS